MEVSVDTIVVAVTAGPSRSEKAGSDNDTLSSVEYPIHPTNFRIADVYSKMANPHQYAQYC